VPGAVHVEKDFGERDLESAGFAKVDEGEGVVLADGDGFG
jgi:hypothetical protein